MTVLSKPQVPHRISFFDSVPYTCYEVAHTWEPSCTYSFLHTVRDSFKFSLQVYLAFYLVTTLPKLRKKKNRNFKTILKFIREVLQSSMFLCANGSVFLGSFCVLRTIFGKFYGWHGILAGFFAGYISIILERKSRRGALALYITNLATETLFHMAVSRGLVTAVPNGEVMLLCLASAGFMSLYRTPGALSESMRTPVAYLVGKCEGGTEERPTQGLNPFLQWIKQLTPKHRTCKHAHSCIYYIAEGGCKQFALGYLIELFLNCLKMARRKAPTNKLAMFINSTSLAYFLGGYTALFRACNCILRWIFNQDKPTLFGGAAGAVAGISSWFYKSSSISLFLLFKLAEEMMFKSIGAGYLPHIPDMDCYIYAMSLALILHVACVEPHNIRSGYWNFLCNVSGRKFPGMFRKMLDCFGTNASTLYPDFIPPLDPKFATSPDVIKVMIASGKWSV
uniref:Transmembrane protein 135 n=1 Tax=Phallusia mammillata TaxID=59560 RepID=A0A6F9DVH7_9ASCI|nr:transmembrane protein 135 [Phallusia mammillata]